MSYTNDLHEALLAKDGPNFLEMLAVKIWDSFQLHIDMVNGCVESAAIANNFAR